MTGKLVGIYTAAAEGAPMEAHDEIAAIAGAGLEGDRYAAEDRRVLRASPAPGARSR